MIDEIGHGIFAASVDHALRDVGAFLDLYREMLSEREE